MPEWDGAGRLGNYKRMVRKGLVEKVRFEQRLEQVRELAKWISG